MAESDLISIWLFEFKRLKSLSEKALAQMTDEQLYQATADDNSVAILIKHIGGNLKSRWTDFLTTDGEKPNRHRDTEFEIGETDTRGALLTIWETGWKAVLSTLESLTESDLNRSVTIRGEEHSVPEAINRSMTHTAYHVGQIVFLCKTMVGENWQTLSIAKGKSSDASKNGKGYFNHYGQ